MTEIKSLLKNVSGIIALILLLSSCAPGPDLMAPSVPSGLSYTATTSSITLSWQASSDNVGVAGYRVYRDGIVAGNLTGTSTSFKDENLVPNSTYTYEVLAFDEAGNESAKSKALKAITEDDCPTCSKWLSSISFTPPSLAGEVFAGEEKLAGRLTLKNISKESDYATLEFVFSEASREGIESLSYKIGEESWQEATLLPGGRAIFEEILVEANSSTEISLRFKAKDILPRSVANNSPISLTLIATSTSEVGVSAPGNRLFPSLALGKFKNYTAKINLEKSYEASSQAEEIELYGNSLAKAFLLEVEEAGLVRIEFVGKKQNGSSPIKYFWVNDKDSEDFNQAVSTLSPIIPKTNFQGKEYIEIELKAGTNLVAFKADSYKDQIENNETIGLKAIGQNFLFENSYRANSSENVAEKVRVIGRIIVGRYIPKKSAMYDSEWASWWIIPQKENGSYDESSFPQIRGAGISLEYWAENYPKLYFEKAEGITPEGFDKDFKLLGGSFGEMPDPNNNHWTIISSESLPDNIVKFENNIVVFTANKYYQTYNADKEAVLTMSFNVYNDYDETFRPKSNYTYLDPAPVGWKFLGNPELELWTEAEVKESIRIL